VCDIFEGEGGAEIFQDGKCNGNTGRDELCHDDTRSLDMFQDERLKVREFEFVR
jgi:hypothetical protein